MRFLQLIIFLVFLGAVGLFAFQNQEAATVYFAKWRITSTFAMLAVTAYVVGMLSGWTVLAFVRRSIGRVRERPSA
jgi:putative membrane protein